MLFTCAQKGFSQGCCNANFSSNKLQNLTWAFYPEDSLNVANYNYNWEFGDGTISTDISPLHTYLISGKYNVKLVKMTESIINQDTVISSCTISKYITVNAIYNTDSCFAEFSVLQTGGFTTLISQSIADSNNYSYWTFGDGNSAYGKYPTHQYSNSGTYTVCQYKGKDSINITSSGCNFCKDINVVVDSVITHSTDSCFANYFYYNSGATYAFIDSTNTNSNNYSYWTFGDGNSAYGESQTHQYFTSGNYTVCQYKGKDSTNMTSSGCNVCKVISVIVDSVITHSTDSCFAGFNYTFTGDSLLLSANIYSGNHVWYMGNGDYISGASTVRYKYNANDTYNICHYVRTAAGDSCHECKLISIQKPIISPNPADNFININSTQDSLVSYILIDNLGTTVASQYNINSMQTSIPTQNIPSGYYTIRILYGLNRNAYYNVLIQH